MIMGSPFTQTSRAALQPALLLLLTGTLAWPQIQLPGQGSPFPGGGGGYPGSGRYPGGGYPGGRGGGIPGRGGREKASQAIPVVSTTGILRLTTTNQFVLGADDHRIITYSTNTKTTVTRDGKPVELASFAKGDHLSVDSTANDDGILTASAVRFQSAGTDADRAIAARTWDLPSLSAMTRSGARSAGANGPDSKGSDDDDRPRLRRAPVPESAAGTSGGQPNDQSDNSDSPAAVDPVDNRPRTEVRQAEAPPDEDDPGPPRLQRGRAAPRRPAPSDAPQESARTVSPASEAATPSPAGGIVSASTPRNSDTATPTDTPSGKPPASEKPPVTIGIPIEEDPLIAKAHEAAGTYAASLPNFLAKQSTTRYRSSNPKTGWEAGDIVTADVTYESGTQTYSNIKVGNKSVNSMEETGGSWSTGEFASWQETLFGDGAQARFQRGNPDTLRTRAAITFKFEVSREHSDWRINSPSQLYYPAYRGTVWIDNVTSRVLRIEVESRGIPLAFPFDKVETAIDYDVVRLAATQSYLLPVSAETLACQRGTTFCNRTRIEFRNYRKFGAESGITFDESSQ